MATPVAPPTPSSGNANNSVVYSAPSPSSDNFSSEIIIDQGADTTDDRQVNLTLNPNTSNIGWVAISNSPLFDDSVNLISYRPELSWDVCSLSGYTQVNCYGTREIYVRFYGHNGQLLGQVSKTVQYSQPTIVEPTGNDSQKNNQPVSPIPSQPISTQYSLCPSRSLSFGNRGFEVKVLQTLLVNKGFLSARPNGVFGPATRRALINFQKANRINAIGIFGPQTRRALCR